MDENTAELEKHKVSRFTQNLREITGYMSVSDLSVRTEDIICDTKNSDGEKTVSDCDSGFRVESLGQFFPSLQIIRGNEPTDPKTKENAVVLMGTGLA